MVNVLHIVQSLNTGGLERFVIELMRTYSADVVAYVVCLEEAGDLAANSEGTTVIALNEKPGLKLWAIYKIIQICKTNKIQLIHTHNEAAHFYGSLAGVLTGLPIVHTRHGRYAHNSSKKMLMNIFSSFLATAIVGVSEDVTNMLIKMEKISFPKALTILNGVDIDQFSPRFASTITDKNNDINRNSIMIGIVARLVKVKDHSNLLKACHELKKSDVNFKLLIVGDGCERSRLENEVDTLGLRECVEFMGVRKDIASILRQLDIYVLSSISEGISLTLLEAMSCSLPVVATDVGGNSEVVIDGETGFIVPARHPELLATKILAMINDNDLRIKMGKSGRERIIKCFSILQTAKTYRQLYQHVMGNIYA